MDEQVKRCVVCGCRWTTSLECPQCFPPKPDPRDAEIARLRETLGLVYGALWCTVQMPNDVPAFPGTYPAHITLPLARERLLEILSRKEQLQGIISARKALEGGA